MDHQRDIVIRNCCVIWSLLCACICTIACGVHNTRSNTAVVTDRTIPPHYRMQDALALYVRLPKTLKTVRGINQYIHRQVNEVNRKLDPSFNIRLHPIFTDPNRRALTLTILTDDTAMNRVPVGYGHFRFTIPLTVEQIARPNDRSLSRVLFSAVLKQLGLPSPCVDGSVRSRDARILRDIVEHHLTRQAHGVEVTQAPVSNFAQSILRTLKGAETMPKCLTTLIGRERLHLWQDANTQFQQSEHDAPKFLYDANLALEKSEFERAYALCGPEAERRPQTGSARCAARAAQGMKNYADASRMWRAHLAFFPDDQPAIIALARCVGRQGDDDTARAILHINVQRFPNWLDAQIELGIALYRLQQTSKARAIWRAVLKVDPSNADAQRLLRQY